MRGDWRLGVLAVYAVACVGVWQAPLNIERVVPGAFEIVILLLMIAPIVPLCLWPRHGTANGIAAVLIGSGGLLLIVDAIYWQPSDPQSALIFLFVPVMQLMAVGIFAAVFAIVLYLARRRNGADR